MTIQDFLTTTTARLHAAGIATARLDAQVLAARALGHDKSRLLAHGEQSIAPPTLSALEQLVARRTAREPLAYLIGQQEFYGRPFVVTPAVLIPRPETEALIEQIKSLPLPATASLVDVGTGSGAIAITAALELPNLQVQAVDISREALKIADQNATGLGASVAFTLSDLLEQKHERYNVIVANLPYVDRAWQRSPETQYEPALALFADHDGLSLINKLIAQAPQKLLPSGFLLLEADPRQHSAISLTAERHGFTLYAVQDFAIILKRRA